MSFGNGRDSVKHFHYCTKNINVMKFNCKLSKQSIESNVKSFKVDINAVKF